jgi:hypothetical protein
MDDLLAGWDRASETVILSAENFRPAHALLIRELLPGAAAAAVLVVRRQDLWIESYYNQLVKTGDFVGDLPTFVEMICEGRQPRLCLPDWSAHHDAWRAVFGDCRVLVYEEVRHDLYARFLDTIAPALGTGAVAGTPEQVSVDVFQLAYLLATPRPIGDADFARRRHAAAEATRRLGAPPPVTLLSARERAALYERFTPSNRHLLAQLGRRFDDSPWAAFASGREHVTLRDVYASGAYAALRDLADELADQV